jgi:integrase
VDKRQPTPLPPGIRARHRSQCASRDGGGCSCRPAYEANVYSKRDSKKLRATFRSLPEAKRWLNAQRKQRDDGGLRAPARITVEDACNEWLDGAREGRITNRSEGRYKPSSLRAIEQAFRLRIAPAIGQMRLSEVTRPQLQRLIGSWRAEGLSASSVRNSTNGLRILFRDAGYLTDGAVGDPTAGLRLPPVRSRRHRAITPADAETLLAALPEHERPVWALALYAGLRAGELCGLRWGDLDWDAALISVARSVDHVGGDVVLPKSAAGVRRVPMSRTLRPFLLAHRLACSWSGDPGGYVFGRSAERPVRPWTLHERARRAWERAKLAPIGLHECRHCFAALMIAAGCDWYSLSKIMGHSDPATSVRLYGGLVDGAERRAGDALDRFLSEHKAAEG